MISPCPSSPVWPHARTSRARRVYDLSTSSACTRPPDDHVVVDYADHARNHICAVQLSITCAGVRRKQVGFVRLAFPVLCIWRRLTLYRDVRPDQSILGIDVEPLFESRLGV